MLSHWQFGHLQPKLWAKEGPGVKLAVWLPTLKVGNRPLPDVRFECATWRLKDLDEGYNFGLDLVAIQLCSRELWRFKVPRVPPDNFGTPFRESREFVPFGCSPRDQPQRILYGGRWWLPSSHGVKPTWGFHKVKLRKIELGSTLLASNSRKG